MTSPNRSEDDTVYDHKIIYHDSRIGLTKRTSFLACVCVAMNEFH